ncbi:MAG: polysaccharide export protein [Candidatus Eisenbacteria bacterium]|uniref:Polysaccharide export protein n=1 Tax=Eiseniibacteriota bacterium TaxID=2212470 RepID=A0A948W6M2_UNCEI|nr:polysaccharide export protein [Candidatus Eisenbacteria bacterium]MBU1949089.1 polysaccharide export protein [Candidatus Eisenbacteria bacterium]MBU2691659.1 polysaccharide export protein [Candidatus Eisenbacteria bacterium]
MRKSYLIRLGVGLAAVLFILSIGAGSAAAADPYIIGPEDVLAISVWEHPELSLAVTVNQSGEFTFPPIGEVTAVGRSPRALARHLEEILETFLRQRVQVTVTVSEYNSRRVHVTGAVNTPGRYSFSEIPHLLEILGLAGGPSPMADLTRVRILRTAVAETTSIVVNMDQVLHSGNLGIVPKLIAGDVIYVPSRVDEGQVVVPGEAGVAYVLGAVARPGPVRVGGGLALTRLLSVVGGILPGGEAEKVRVLTLGNGEVSPWVMESNVKEMLETGEIGPSVLPGELVYVPPYEPGVLQSARNAIVEFGGLSRDIVNILLIIDYLNN